MDEDMMGMQVNPVMTPEQPMMQGTPAPQQMPGQMQSELDEISSFSTTSRLNYGRTTDR